MSHEYDGRCIERLIKMVEVYGPLNDKQRESMEIALKLANVDGRLEEVRAANDRLKLELTAKG